MAARFFILYGFLRAREAEERDKEPESLPFAVLIPSPHLFGTARTKVLPHFPVVNASNGRLGTVPRRPCPARSGQKF